MRTSMIAASLMTLSFGTPVFADTPGSDWLSSTSVAESLTKQGYEVKKIEADDGHWEGEAVRDGNKYDFHVDPHTGQVTKMERDRD